ncbi:hypothetical protein [Flavimarina sp. Hel_I_48]|uniref:hypothetical protein n=1 Tax=Flavimarina sp. Hel_I_48 TaxID=1392488 RepID=UPI0013D9A773|nr:hypothetical protein [Flavimarina sp. Hel_I_48]
MKVISPLIKPVFSTGVPLKKERWMRPSKIKIGAHANLVILEAKSAIEVLRTVAQPLAGFKDGRQTFSNEKAVIYLINGN